MKEVKQREADKREKVATDLAIASVAAMRADIMPGDVQTPNVFHDHVNKKDMLLRDNMINIIRRNDAPGNVDGKTHKAIWFCHLCNITYSKTVALCPKCHNRRDIIREAGRDYRGNARLLVHDYK